MREKNKNYYLFQKYHRNFKINLKEESFYIIRS